VKEADQQECRWQAPEAEQGGAQARCDPPPPPLRQTGRCRHEPQPPRRQRRRSPPTRLPQRLPSGGARGWPRSDPGAGPEACQQAPVPTPQCPPPVEAPARPRTAEPDPQVRGGGSGRGGMPHDAPTEAHACLSGRKERSNRGKPAGKRVVSSHRPRGLEPIARAHVEPRRSTETARGRLTVGRRGATPPSAVASPLKRARRPYAGLQRGSPVQSYPNPAGPDSY